jgi:hypothetical protein
VNRVLDLSKFGVLLTLLLAGCVERLIIEERDVDIERICEQVCTSQITCPPEYPFASHEECLDVCNTLTTWADPCTVEQAESLECHLELSCEERHAHTRDPKNGPCGQEGKELIQCGRDNGYI